MKRSVASYLLIFLIFIQIISAVPAGWILITDPSGINLGLPIEMLQYSPFPDFLIPGLFLFIVLGIFPTIIVYGLIKKPEFKLINKINLYKKYHWSWTFSYYLGLLLVLWINMELLFIREYSFLQVIISVLGVAIIFITHLPRTKRDYIINSAHE